MWRKIATLIAIFGVAALPTDLSPRTMDADGHSDVPNSIVAMCDDVCILTKESNITHDPEKWAEHSNWSAYNALLKWCESNCPKYASANEQ